MLFPHSGDDTGPDDDGSDPHGWANNTANGFHSFLGGDRQFLIEHFGHGHHAVKLLVLNPLLTLLQRVGDLKLVPCPLSAELRPASTDPSRQPLLHLL